MIEMLNIEKHSNDSFNSSYYSWNRILQPTYLAYLQPFSFFIILSFTINEIHILNLSMFNSRMSIIFMNKWIDLD